ncbi:LacI family DNA-binding transcriptional regulator [Microbacterium dextranolyticum]|uniref:LacI family transcriptional regulator n=2 Tax=Microbacterium dextranolyticum TaxID=36806 RepID=A0A9W6HKA8_9MICO|nr:LacI family DNA-binding transcriptional regulator [Microbacterium dextranolyticum]MBM7463769.1 LacI family transcriptional regulator [Microbacterium dextranolyticum]GLJ94850.1 LacI family transcriptional regulator [Microbacterium dextranolyticum]
MNPSESRARVTLADVARRAEVSLKTASRALNAEPYVTEHTRQRVLEAAAELGYERNAAATLLASGQRSDTVGLITGDLSNPFYTVLAVGIEGALRESGMRLSVASSAESPEQEWSLASAFASAQARAIIVASSLRDHTPYAALISRGIPVVFVDRPAVGIEADSVVFGDVDGGRAAAEHLLARGHRRIAFLGDYDWLPTSRGRLEGITERLRTDSEAAGGAGDGGASSLVVRMGVHGPDDAAACTAELLALDEPPTAIVAGNNRITLGVAAQSRRLDPGRRPALLGFDDFEWSDVVGISVVAGDAAHMGEVAARRALARMGDREERPTQTTLPMRLIERGSGERLAADPA